ncbi:MAG: hypothetical protein QW273_02145, partial [Candidatus Pacearchaeota archaeon]
LIVQIVKGCSEPIYPSQNSDCDNLFFEEVFPGLNLPPNSRISFPFYFNLTNSFGSGNYRLDVFLDTGRTHIVGLPSVFLPGKSRSFRILGNNSYEEVKFLRTKINIKNKTGPIGVGVSPLEEVTLYLYINSEIEDSFSLFYSLCEWKDPPCDNSVFEKEEKLNLKKGENYFEIKFQAPNISGVYSIPLILKKDNKIFSIYRSRIIVYGEDARIRKIYPNKAYYNNENLSLMLVTSGSPDHYNNYLLKDVEGVVKIRDLDSGKTYEKKLNLSFYNDEINKNKLSFFINSPLKKFEICGQLIDGKSKRIYDDYCYTIESENFLTESVINLTDKRYENGIFFGELCVFDKHSNFPWNTTLSLFVFKNDSLILRNEIEVSGCKEISFNIDQEEIYKLLVINKKDTKQFEFFISSEEEKKEVKNKSTIILIILLIFIILSILFILIKKIQNKRKGEENEVS